MRLLKLYFPENLMPIKTVIGLKTSARPLRILLNENVVA